MSTSANPASSSRPALQLDGPTPQTSHFNILPPTAHLETEEDDGEHSAYSSDNENDTASQRSISLSSPPHSPQVQDFRRQSLAPNPFDHTQSTKFSPTASYGQPTVSPTFQDSMKTPTPAEPALNALTPVSLVRQNLLSNKRESQALTISSASSDPDHDETDDDRSMFMRRLDEELESPLSSAAPSILDKHSSMDDTKFSSSAPPLPSKVKSSLSSPPLSTRPPPTSRDSGSLASSSANTYPPPAIGVSLVNHHHDSRDSMASYASSVASMETTASGSYSKKVRPESLLLQQTKGPLVCGIALVDFNHLVSTLLVILGTDSEHAWHRLDLRSSSHEEPFLITKMTN